MLHFECDYACGAADVVLKALVESNIEQHCGYSEDERCERARAIIREKCAAPDAMCILWWAARRPICW